MNKITLAILLLFATLTSNAQTVQVDWLQTSLNSGNSSSTCVDSDTSGNAYVGGVFSGTLTLGTMTTSSSVFNLFVAKHDYTGGIVWAQHFVSAGDCNINKLLTDISGNIYIVGFFEQSITFGGYTLSNPTLLSTCGFLTKISPAGEVLWAKGIGTNSIGRISCGISDLMLDSSGNIVISGTYELNDLNMDSTILPNIGQVNFFVTKYNSNGESQWAKSGYCSSSSGFFTSPKIAITNNGDIYLTDLFLYSVTFGGQSVSGSSSNFRVFLVKFNSSGLVQFVTRFGTNGNVVPYDLAIDNDGKLYMLGCYDNSSLTFGTTTLNNSGNTDVFLVKLDSSANSIWAKKIGGSGLDRGNSITVNGDQLFVAGEFRGSSVDISGITLTNELGTSTVPNRNGFLAKYLLDGSVTAAVSPLNIGDTSFREVGSKGNFIYLIGNFENGFEFDNHNISSTDYNFFISKLNSNLLNNSDLSKPKFQIYPNPTSGVLNILTSTQLNRENFKITTILGQKVNINLLYENSVDLSFLTPGLYVIKIGNEYSKFIKK